MKFYIDTLKGKKKMIGHFANGELKKTVQFSKHHFHKGKAWGIDLGIFERLAELNCQQIKLIETEERKIWTAEFNVFVAKHWKHEFKGFQTQVFLADDRWLVTDFAGNVLQSPKVDKIVEPEKTEGVSQTRLL